MQTLSRFSRRASCAPRTRPHPTRVSIAPRVAPTLRAADSRASIRCSERQVPQHVFTTGTDAEAIPAPALSALDMATVLAVGVVAASCSAMAGQMAPPAPPAPVVAMRPSAALQVPGVPSSPRSKAVEQRPPAATSAQTISFEAGMKALESRLEVGAAIEVS